MRKNYPISNVRKNWHCKETIFSLLWQNCTHCSSQWLAFQNFTAILQSAMRSSKFLNLFSAIFENRNCFFLQLVKKQRKNFKKSAKNFLGSFLPDEYRQTSSITISEMKWILDEKKDSLALSNNYFVTRLKHSESWNK